LNAKNRTDAAIKSQTVLSAPFGPATLDVRQTSPTLRKDPKIPKGLI
jgi:hypothetical protein